ncbi:unnamed protein product [Kuraishia capsulata CBS 1993]|uniref:Alternative oxidase n=1 Tax=Kuraishia capsulata CBS 1993 TaxID=1382522 RepID=W6MSC3_9ASCO|nr:uncharacterized protein KUCA_T00005281001 [Kuraishia capsulata CBS 1993]CDK29293.1 unnamed protein product [Kuraishia capsulata CBS 1993]
MLVRTIRTPIYTRACATGISSLMHKRLMTIVATPASKPEVVLGDHEKVNHTAIENADNEFISDFMFSHPGYNKVDMDKVTPGHRPTKTITDWVAFFTMRCLRTSFDFFSGYKHAENVSEEEIKTAIAEGHPERYTLTSEQWLSRIVFLESIAGVPGSVAGFIRHLHSLRMLRRDKAFVETLLEEAYNERMHLLTFLQIGNPGWFARSLLYVGQGVFCNLFFAFYLISPKICHRFVGYLEEEAVLTYTRCLNDIDRGLIAGLDDYEVPDIAKRYWRMEDNASMRDLINYVRADEAKHAEVNHSFANLKLNGEDRNPFALKIEGVNKPQPSKGLETLRMQGWEREDLIV